MQKTIGDNVVSIGTRQIVGKFSALAQIEGYWEGLRRGRAAPLRSEVDPRGLDSVIEYAFILDSVAPGVARLRVAGSHLSDIMGMEVRGMPLTALVLPEARDELANAIDYCFKGGVAQISLRSPTGWGRSELVGGMILLPLFDQDGKLTKILGGLQTRGQIGRQPRRFELTDVNLIRGEMSPPEAAMERVFTAEPLERTIETLDGQPRLRLVVDNSTN